MGEVHELAVEPLAGDLFDLEPGMRERKSQQLAPGIAGGAHDRNGSHYADAPSASEIAARCGCSPSRHPFAAFHPRAATSRQKSTIRSGMSTLVGAMLLRNSIV